MSEISSEVILQDPKVQKAIADLEKANEGLASAKYEAQLREVDVKCRKTNLLIHVLSAEDRIKQSVAFLDDIRANAKTAALSFHGNTEGTEQGEERR